MATTYLKNTNSHGVAPGNDRSERIAPGAVVALDSDEAKKYDGINGVEKVNKGDHDDYLAANGGPSSDQSPSMARQELVDEAVRSANAVPAALAQVVIGDDQAPFGPPSGEQSTKVQEAEKGDLERLAFADHEALSKVDEPEEKFTAHAAPKSAVVHNQQAENKAAVEEIAAELAQAGQDDEPTDANED